MKQRYRLLHIILIFTIRVVSINCEEILTVSGGQPVVDGKIEDNEYTLTVKLEDMLTLYFKRTIENLYIGVVGTTTGRVSVGLNSLKMYKSKMVMGMVKDGIPECKSVYGFFLIFHWNAKKPYYSDWSVTEENNITTMELEFSAKDYINPEDDELKVIVGRGLEDSFTTIHDFRDAFSIKLK